MLMPLIPCWIPETGGRYNVSMRLSRALSGFTNLIFNSRIVPGISNVKRKRLRPGKLSPRRPVPDHILKPPYVNTGQSPGISTGIEVHDQKGIECMKASIVKASMHENFVWSVDSATNELSLFHCAFGVLFLLFFRCIRPSHQYNVNVLQACFPLLALGLLTSH
ncbi:hypothetical protein LINPERHAP2_LOCUS41046 [Linum perenne]